MPVALPHQRHALQIRLHRSTAPSLFPISSTNSSGDPMFTTRSEPTAAEFREINCPTFGAVNVTV